MRFAPDHLDRRPRTPSPATRPEPTAELPPTSRPASTTALALALALAVLPFPATGQTVESEEEESHLQVEHEEEEHHSIAGRHRITLGLGHTHISQGVIEGSREWFVAPSWALNYDYWLTERWAVGLQNDMIVEQFVIAHGDEELLERDRPVAVIPTVLYKPLHWLTLIGGVGVEFASEENLTLTRLGAEVGWHVAADWEVGAGLVWDAKWDFYDSYALDFSISRFLGSGR
jgi:hypothetical protein